MERIQKLHASAIDELGTRNYRVAPTCDHAPSALYNRRLFFPLHLIVKKTKQKEIAG